MMRNVWMIVSGLATVVAIGGAVYYFFPKQPAEPIVSDASNVPQHPSTGSRVLVVPAGNPLLTADAAQFSRWVSLYPIRCGEIVFEKADPKAKNYSFCIAEIRRRVATATGQQLSRDDVLDPRVRVHWREVTGAK